MDGNTSEAEKNWTNLLIIISCNNSFLIELGGISREVCKVVKSFASDFFRCKVRMFVRQITGTNCMEPIERSVEFFLQANASVTIKVINIKVILLITLRDLMIPIRTQTHLNTRVYVFSKCVCICLNANRKHKAKGITWKKEAKTKAAANVMYIISNQLECWISTVDGRKKCVLCMCVGAAVVGCCS